VVGFDELSAASLAFIMNQWPLALIPCFHCKLYRSTRLKALAFSHRVTQGSQPMKKSLAVFVSAVAFVMVMLAPHKASAQGVNIYVAPGYSHYSYGYPRYGYGYGYRPYYNYGYSYYPSYNYGYSYYPSYAYGYGYRPYWRGHWRRHWRRWH
jgi:hypothetical protein